MRGKSKRRKEALLLRPADHRAAVLKVKRETDVGLQCAKYEGLEYRIFKHGPAWSFPNMDRFLVVEGTPVTTYINEEEENHSVTVQEFLKFAWGDEKFYNKLPDNLKEPLEGKWGATVTVKPVEIEPGVEKILDKIKAGGLLREHNIGVFEDFAESKPKRDKMKDLITFMTPILLGFFAGIVVTMKGWF